MLFEDFILTNANLKIFHQIFNFQSQKIFLKKKSSNFQHFENHTTRVELANVL
jgi:hypothetical protein